MDAASSLSSLVRVAPWSGVLCSVVFPLLGARDPSHGCSQPSGSHGGYAFWLEFRLADHAAPARASSLLLSPCAAVPSSLCLLLMASGFARSRCRALWCSLRAVPKPRLHRGAAPAAPLALPFSSRVPRCLRALLLFLQPLCSSPSSSLRDVESPRRVRISPGRRRRSTRCLSPASPGPPLSLSSWSSLAMVVACLRAARVPARTAFASAGVVELSAYAQLVLSLFAVPGRVELPCRRSPLVVCSGVGCGRFRH